MTVYKTVQRNRYIETNADEAVDAVDVDEAVDAVDADGVYIFIYTYSHGIQDRTTKPVHRD